MYDSFIHLCFFFVLVWVLWKHGHPFQRWVLLFTITLGLLVHWSLGLFVPGLTVLLEVKNGFLEDELSLRNEHLLSSIKWRKGNLLGRSIGHPGAVNVPFLLNTSCDEIVMKFWLYIESLDRSNVSHLNLLKSPLVTSASWVFPLILLFVCGRYVDTVWYIGVRIIQE